MSKVTSAFRGGILTIAMRWTDRLLGLASTLILARLLSPADFGLVAMAMIIVGLVDVLLDLGVASALIQNSSADRHDFDSAWTLRLAQSILSATALVVAAPYCAEYYHDPRVADVVRVVAISVLIGGLENIGIVMFQKNMAFGLDFKFFVTKRAVTTIVTITLAVMLRSYWALVLGSLIGRAVGVALSYLMHAFRPRISVKNVGRIWSFSQWNLVMNVASYVSTRLDKFVLGKKGNAGTLGAYALADEVASLPTSELLAPLGRVMYPAFVRARGDSEEFRRLVLLAFAVQALIGIPAGLGVALVAPQAVPVMLGDQWGEAVPLVQILGMTGVFATLVHSSHYMLLALGRVRTLSIYYIGQAAGLAAALFILLPSHDAMNIAEARLLVAAAALILMAALARSAMPSLRLSHFFRYGWRPIIATAVMTVAVSVVGAISAEQPQLMLLVVKILVGVVAYGASIAVLWIGTGRPDGAERYILSAASSKRRLPNESASS